MKFQKFLEKNAYPLYMILCYAIYKEKKINYASYLS